MTGCLRKNNSKNLSITILAAMTLALTACSQAKDAANSAKDATVSAADKAGNAAKDAAAATKDAGGAMVDKANAMADKAGDAMKDAGGAMADKANAMVDKAGEMKVKAGDAMMDKADAMADKAGAMKDKADAMADKAVESEVFVDSVKPKSRLSNFLKSLVEAPMALEISDKTIVNVPIVATLSINGVTERFDKNTSSTHPVTMIERKKSLSSSLDSKPRIKKVVKVSNKVRAKIEGVDFNIIEQSPETQNLSPLDVTKWSWRLTSEVPGIHEVNVVLYAVDGEEVTQVKSFDATVSVEVESVDWLQKLWRLLNPTVAFISAICGIVGLLLPLKFSKDKKRRNNILRLPFEEDEKIDDVNGV